jgi:amidase
LDAFEAALDTLRDLGATVIDPADLPSINELLDIFEHTAKRFTIYVDFKVRRKGKRIKSII